MNILLIPIILFSSYLVYHATVYAFRQTSFESPRFLPLAVAALTGVAMFHLDNAVITAILLPYAALGVALLLLLLLLWLVRIGGAEKLQELFGDLLKLIRHRPPPESGTSDDSARIQCRRRPKETKE